MGVSDLKMELALSLLQSNILPNRNLETSYVFYFISSRSFALSLISCNSLISLTYSFLIFCDQTSGSSILKLNSSVSLKYLDNSSDYNFNLIKP